VNIREACGHVINRTVDTQGREALKAQVETQCSTSRASRIFLRANILDALRIDKSTQLLTLGRGRLVGAAPFEWLLPANTLCSWSYSP
jgi:hypothetical protein